MAIRIQSFLLLLPTFRPFRLNPIRTDRLWRLRNPLHPAEERPRGGRGVHGLGPGRVAATVDVRGHVTGRLETVAEVAEAEEVAGVRGTTGGVVTGVPVRAGRTGADDPGLPIRPDGHLRAVRDPPGANVLRIRQSLPPIWIQQQFRPYQSLPAESRV